jgi:hypothetical protein
MTSDRDDPRTAAVRIESLLAELGASGDARVRGAAEDLVRQLMQLYGAGLERLMEIAHEHDADAAAALFERLAGDPLVASLLALHGLHPHTLEQRLSRAIERVRPIVEAAGACLTIVAADEDAVRLHLGTAAGATAPGANVRPIVERAIAEAAPEVRRIEVDGDAPAAPLLQITAADGTPLSSRPRIPRAGAQA